MLLHDGPAVEPPRRRRLHRTSVFIAPKLYVTNYVPQNVSVSLGTVANREAKHLASVRDCDRINGSMKVYFVMCGRGYFLASQ
jgi:hypothetical protein